MSRKNLPSVFYVVNSDTGMVLNRVAFSEKEKDRDDLETRERKRLALATGYLDGWLKNYNPNLNLEIQERSYASHSAAFKRRY